MYLVVRDLASVSLSHWSSAFCFMPSYFDDFSMERLIPPML